MAKSEPQNPNQSPAEIWQTATSAETMLHAAPGLLTPRRQRLFAIACCRSLWGERQICPRYLELLELAELMADNTAAERMIKLMVQAKPFRQVAFPHGVIH